MRWRHKGDQKIFRKKFRFPRTPPSTDFNIDLIKINRQMKILIADKDTNGR